MLGKHTRLSKILFLIIFVKVFILLVLLCLNTTDIQRRSHGHGRGRGRVVLINELLIDRREAPSLQERLKLIREEMPSFPLEELLRRPRNAKQQSCGEAPDFMNIEYHNDYWQVLHNGNTTYYLFGAYYDDREAVPKTPLVRLLTMINRYGKANELKYPLTYCQLWYKDRVDPVIVEAVDYKIVWLWGGAPRRVFPTLISCPLPKAKSKTNSNQEVPEMVSLVSDRCDRAKNLLRVVHETDEVRSTTQIAKSPPGNASEKQLPEKEKPLRFMVCLKAMDFPYTDMSWRLIEWLELVRLLGVDKVVFYDAQMHANMTRVLDDYKASSPGFVEVRPMSLGRGEPHSPRHFHHYAMDSDGFNRILNEMIPYNDCYYRNIYKYDYIGLFDIDEVIMPLGNVTNWNDLIKLAYRVPDYERDSSKCKDWVSFCFRNVYFPRYVERPKVYKQLPSYYYMLQHVERVQEHCDRYSATKCLHSTKYAIGLHNHFPLHRAETGECDAKSVPIEFAQLHHYREPDNKTRLINPIIDDNIWRFQPQLQQRVYAKYEKLGFLPTIHEVELAEEQRIHKDEQQLREAISKT
ncbi:hypothetical protein ACLKA7_007343 [Drosophila subpalustris]